MKIDTDPVKIEELLTRGVFEIIDRDNLEKKLKAGGQLRVKLGIDPTSPNIHLGRSIPLLKLRDFQQLGHKIVFIIGDFTGTIGDTSDKESERPMLSVAEVNENLKTYIDQAGKILDIEKTEINRNNDWLGKLNFAEIGYLADAFSVSDFIARDNIRRRLDKGSRVSLRELLYPLMQGYDSVMVKADVELGGTDQRFNLLAGRTIQKLYKQSPQDILINPLIEGLDGRKMSSSYGNGVNLFDSPNDMFGKIMSVNDNLIIKYFAMLTRVPMAEIAEYQKSLEIGDNPKEIKLKLAFEITRMYHDNNLATLAQDYFENTFAKKIIPDDLPEFKPKDYGIISLLVESGLSSSNGEARRLIEQKGIKINGNVVDDVNFFVPQNSVLQKGKIHFLKIV